MLESVVSEEGTAPTGRRSTATGSPARREPRTGSTTACGCYRGYTASFIGFAPADDPALVVAVTLQEPKNGHYGGMLGGPVFKQVMSFGLASLQVPPTGHAADALPAHPPLSA